MLGALFIPQPCSEILISSFPSHSHTGVSLASQLLRKEWAWRREEAPLLWFLLLLFCFLSLKINLATLQISLRKAARLLEDCSHCFNLLKDSWWPKSKTHQGLSETLRLLGFMDSFSTWQRELDSNASQQRHQMATAVYRVCTRGTYSFLLAISSLTSQARKWSYCLGEYKRLQQKVLSPTCLLSGKITKRFVLAVGFLPRAEFLCSTQWHNAAAALPLKHKLHEKNPSEWMSQEKSNSV